VQIWLRTHPRIHLHFTPTSTSWLNQVETWFSIVHRKAIRRGVLRSVPHLKDAIQRFIDSWNTHRHPFAWVKTADEILVHANQKASNPWRGCCTRRGPPLLTNLLTEGLAA
jgi:DDE superfamily endonuclease